MNQQAQSRSDHSRSGANEGTLGNWVVWDLEARQDTEGLFRGDVEELKRLRAEVAELRMERDVLIG